MKRCIWSRLWAAGIIVCGLALVLICAFARAQQIQVDGLGAPAPDHHQRVTLESEKFIIPAAHPEWIDVVFHVDPGFHINSHDPRDETLIPTALRLTPSPTVQVLKDAYPPGLPMHLNIGAGQTLSTYAGQFHVRVQVVAQKGDSTLSGTLHYQACDAGSCYPPRDLPVSFQLSSR